MSRKLNKKDNARDKYLRRTYGLGLADYNKILKEQDGKCFVCRRPREAFKRNFAVDHCHRTLIVRGLLCSFCNRGLRFYQDNPEWLRRASEHVIRNSGFIAPRNRKRRRKKRK